MRPASAVAPSTRSSAEIPGSTILRAMIKITTSTAAVVRWNRSNKASSAAIATNKMFSMIRCSALYWSVGCQSFGKSRTTVSNVVTAAATRTGTESAARNRRIMFPTYRLIIRSMAGCCLTPVSSVSSRYPTDLLHPFKTRVAACEYVSNLLHADGKSRERATIG
jgi:hypothetical protein